MTVTGRFFARRVFPLLADIEVRGHENIPAGGGFILASNHIGRFDSLMAYHLLDTKDVIQPFTDKYKNSLVFRFVGWALGMTWIRRGEPDIKTMREIITRLKKGGALVIAPEGTRSKTATMIKGESGVIFIAAQSGAQVIPVGVTGTEDAIVKSRWKSMKRLKIILYVGKPYTPPSIKGADRDHIIEAATEDLMCRIAALLPESYRGVYKDLPRTLELIAAH